MWIKVIHLWRIVVDMMRERNDFSDQEIEEFGDACDDFYGEWIELVRQAGVTNYFHLVGVGHLVFS